MELRFRALESGFHDRKSLIPIDSGSNSPYALVVRAVVDFQ